MDYPILEHGREIGRLHAREDGLYTVFEARLPRREGLTRLYLCGGGECRCLGLMEPDGAALYLRRRLSRRALPESVVCAATEPDPQPGPDAPPEETQGWIAAGHGALYHAQRRLLALPAALRRKRPGLRCMAINGKEYIVFRL